MCKCSFPEGVSVQLGDAVVDPCQDCIIVKDPMDIPMQVQTSCIICGEGIPVYIGDYRPRVCALCRAAVMKVRSEMDG